MFAQQAENLQEQLKLFDEYHSEYVDAIEKLQLAQELYHVRMQTQQQEVLDRINDITVRCLDINEQLLAISSYQTEGNDKLGAQSQALVESSKELLLQSNYQADCMKTMSAQQSEQLKYLENLAVRQNNQILYLRGISDRQKEKYAKMDKFDSQVIDLEKRTQREVVSLTGITKEILWASIYNNAVSESDWLKENDFAPGRWAVGYPLLFVLFSILNKEKPKSILELGLGQSTHMIVQYAKADLTVEHVVLEQNEAWIEFFKKDHVLSKNTTIKLLAYNDNAFYNNEAVRTYDKFDECTSGKKYDLILVDAPSYNGTSLYSRVDILGIIPACLDNRFVIILDDCQRPGESKTAEEITRILTEEGIAFVEKAYRGEKIFRIWCSVDQEYLCTL